MRLFATELQICCIILSITWLIEALDSSDENNGDDEETIVYEAVVSNPSVPEQWEDLKISETVRNKRRTNDRKNKKRDRLRYTPIEKEPPVKEDDNYHVRYSTKFAFQNVDEFGLKVKYNKTENVFYGDTVPAIEPQTPFEAVVKPDHPAALTFITTNEVENEPPRESPVQSLVLDPVQHVNAMPPNQRVRRSLRDSSLAFPPMSKIVFGPQDKMDYNSRRAMGQGGRDQEKSRKGVNGLWNGDGPMKSRNTDWLWGSDNGDGLWSGRNDDGLWSMKGPDGLWNRRRSKFGSGRNRNGLGGLGGFGVLRTSKRSRELEECRRMNFAPGSNAMHMNGICLVCLRNEDEYGNVLFSVKGCPAVDCEEFELPDPYDKFPLCCPTCRGARIPHKQEDYLDTSDDESSPDYTVDDEEVVKGEDESVKGEEGKEDNAGKEHNTEEDEVPADDEEPKKEEDENEEKGEEEAEEGDPEGARRSMNPQKRKGKKPMRKTTEKPTAIPKRRSQETRTESHTDAPKNKERAQKPHAKDGTTPRRKQRRQ